MDPRPMRIFHLDAGRKFFSVESIKRLLRAMAAAELSHLELYLSDNQGLRFGLEDMTVTTSFGTYDLTPCLGDGYKEGDKGPDGTNGFHSEADMDEIISYAASFGIGVIPVINMPGHMGAILEHFPQLRYPGSDSSVQLKSEEAVEFALEILRKYLAFFKSRGCTHYHLGADEYANDVGTMGFDRIYRDGDMKCFVSFINRAISIVCDEGLIPMAFNDGIYYNDDKTAYGPIDNRLMVCYWIQGWNTYFPADAAFLAAEGFPLVNAHHEFYCGMGMDTPSRVAKMADYDPRLFHRESRVENAAGAMLCHWSDRAYADGPDGGTAAAERMELVIPAFGAAMKKYNF